MLPMTTMVVVMIILTTVMIILTTVMIILTTVVVILMQVETGLGVERAESWSTGVVRNLDSFGVG